MSMSSKAEKELENFELVFRALAHSSRRHILTVLNSRGGTMGAGEIVKRFSCSWPTMTRHLRVLEDAGLLIVTKLGREWIYELNSNHLNETLGGWMKWFEIDKEGEINE